MSKTGSWWLAMHRSHWVKKIPSFQTASKELFSFSLQTRDTCDVALRIPAVRLDFNRLMASHRPYIRVEIHRSSHRLDFPSVSDCCFPRLPDKSAKFRLASHGLSLRVLTLHCLFFCLIAVASVMAHLWKLAYEKRIEKMSTSILWQDQLTGLGSGFRAVTVRVLQHPMAKLLNLWQMCETNLKWLTLSQKTHLLKHTILKNDNSNKLPTKHKRGMYCSFPMKTLKIPEAHFWHSLNQREQINTYSNLMLPKGTPPIPADLGIHLPWGLLKSPSTKDTHTHTHVYVYTHTPAARFQAFWYFWASSLARHARECWWPLATCQTLFLYDFFSVVCFHPILKVQPQQIKRLSLSLSLSLSHSLFVFICFNTGRGASGTP